MSNSSEVAGAKGGNVPRLCQGDISAEPSQVLQAYFSISDRPIVVQCVSILVLCFALGLPPELFWDA